MKRLKKAASVLLLLAAVHPAFGEATYFTETNKTIHQLGMQGTTAYVNFAEGLTRTCAWGMAYVPPDRKGIYTHLLAAKLAGKRISRVDYTQAGGNGTQCIVELVEIME